MRKQIQVVLPSLSASGQPSGSRVPSEVGDSSHQCAELLSFRQAHLHPRCLQGHWLHLQRFALLTLDQETFAPNSDCTIFRVPERLS